ncbi:glycoside hydrolase family 31 protein [Knoellia sp. 3-2P3]|uniref:glycoside hydrolase family 31 protein n=1 Tax=unclassified Knoellia TaxID=2618719 RepID=UPI0023DA9E76|nr:TIM-barrel domain-containing protein [Knoellia sp. 3-2P3]MDF2092139.1 glycoside hydrolase family 31 protein [Knoellia sp. 3-2P3]
MIDTDGYRRFERVDDVSETATGLLARVHGEQLRIDVVRDDVARVKISRGGVFDESPTYAVCVDPLAQPPVFSVERGDGVVRLRAAAMVVSLWLDPFRVDVHRPDGTPVVETAQDGEGRYWAYATLNDAFTVRRRCRQEDALYGLGEKTGRQNRKGRDFTLWNTDVLNPSATAEFRSGLDPDDPRADRTSTEFDPYYVSIPFFYHHIYPSGAMSGSFVDNGYRAAYEFAHRDEYRFHFAGGQYTEYIFAGPRMPDILTAYTWLTGRTAPPPLWALGYHQCRWFDYTQDAVEALAQRHRDSEIPCDALWLDIEYMDGYRVFTWNEKSFPDPAGMLERLREKGFRVITIIDPGVKHDPGYWVYDQAVERDVLCRTEGGDIYIGEVWPGDTAFPDFATEEARSWWGELNAAHVRSGLAGIWNDMNEPATGVIDPRAMRFDHGRESHERYHNQYALLMAMGTTQGLREAMPDLRTFVLSRAGFAGIQRYAANWMGDNMSRWDHLWLSMPMAAGFGISGQAFVGADIGGFAGNSNAELYLRWMQYGVLTPFCRNHSEIGNVDQYAWAWGDVVLHHVREALRLRYRLLPYIYAAFLTAAETGAPVQRPLVFDFQDDPLTRDLDDQYLFGPDLLVAPVVEAGQVARQVYLPAGEWYDWYSGERYDGTRFLRVDTPMDHIPLFARAGAVVPMWPQAPASTDGHHPDTVELHLFVPATEGRHESVLREDDGLTFAADQGRHLRTTLVVERSGDSVTVRAAVEGEGYPEFRREAFRLVVHGATPDQVQHDGEAVHAEEGAADRAFTLPNSGQPFEVAFTVG